MSEPVTVTTLNPLTVDMLLFLCRVAGCRPGRDVLIISRRAFEETEYIYDPRAVFGVDEDGYVWIDQRRQR